MESISPTSSCDGAALVTKGRVCWLVGGLLGLSTQVAPESVLTRTPVRPLPLRTHRRTQAHTQLTRDKQATRNTAMLAKRISSGRKRHIHTHTHTQRERERERGREGEAEREVVAAQLMGQAYVGGRQCVDGGHNALLQTWCDRKGHTRARLASNRTNISAISSRSNSCGFSVRGYISWAQNDGYCIFWPSETHCPKKYTEDQRWCIVCCLTH